MTLGHVDKTKNLGERVVAARDIDAGAQLSSKAATFMGCVFCILCIPAFVISAYGLSQLSVRSANVHEECLRSISMLTLEPLNLTRHHWVFGEKIFLNPSLPLPIDSKCAHTTSMFAPYENGRRLSIHTCLQGADHDDYTPIDIRGKNIPKPEPPFAH